MDEVQRRERGSAGAKREEHFDLFFSFIIITPAAGNDMTTLRCYYRRKTISKMGVGGNGGWLVRLSNAGKTKSGGIDSDPAYPAVMSDYQQ